MTWPPSVMRIRIAEKRKTVLFAGPMLFALFCALRGLHVHIQGTDAEVLVALA